MAAALHIYACRVLQRLIEHCGHRPQLLSLLEDLMVPGTRDRGNLEVCADESRILP